MVAVPRDRFCPPGIYGQKNNTLSQRQGKSKRDLQFCLVPVILRPCNAATAAAAPFQSSAAATAADLLLVENCLGRGMVGGRGRMVFDAWFDLMVDGVDIVVSTDGALLPSAGLC